MTEKDIKFKMNRLIRTILLVACISFCVSELNGTALQGELYDRNRIYDNAPNDKNQSHFYITIE